MRCLRPLLGLLATACVGSPPPPPGPALGTAGDASTTDAPSTDAADTASSTTTDPSASSVGSTAAGPCDPPCATDQTCIDGVCFDSLCDPACPPDQLCIDGVCFDKGATDTTTGEPPPECGHAVQLEFPNPACAPCIEESCCTSLQACFGDETTTRATQCLELNNCLAMNCAKAMTLEDLQACADQNCPAFAASFDDWLAFQSCLGSSCAEQCT